MMKNALAVLVAVIMVASVLPADAATGFTARGGTLGIGIEITQSIVPRVNARVGYNYFKYDYNTTKDGIPYEFDLRLRSANFFADFHPFVGSGFRLSAGLLYSKNRVDLTAQPSISYDIGGQTYTSDDIGTLTGKADLKDWPLYVGVGWGNAASGSIGLAFDLGVAFSGSPAVDLNSAGGGLTGAAALELEQRLTTEEQNLEDDIKGFKFYPNLSLGISLHVPGL